VGQRADVGFLGVGVTEHERRHVRDESFGEFLVHVGVDQEALCRDARLAVVLASRHRGDRGCLGDVRRRHHDERVSAAEFEYCLLQVSPGGFGDCAAGRRAPGHRCRPHPVIGDDPLHLAGIDEQGGERPVRKTGAAEQVFEEECCLWNV
jgi:hypothetical protein